jgi:hypothetical protein
MIYSDLDLTFLFENNRMHTDIHHEKRSKHEFI